jgi:hypothetical protein
MERLKELITLPTEIDKLRLEMVEYRNRRTGNQNESYEAAMAALKQVRDNISPDELKLPDNSVLRQLFASFHNLVTALLKPIESRAILMPHVRALVHQARAFSPESPETTT